VERDQRWRTESQKVNAAAVREGEANAVPGFLQEWRHGVELDASGPVLFSAPAWAKDRSAADLSQSDVARVRYFWFWHVFVVRLTLMHSMWKSGKSQEQVPWAVGPWKRKFLPELSPFSSQRVSMTLTMSAMAQRSMGCSALKKWLKRSAILLGLRVVVKGVPENEVDSVQAVRGTLGRPWRWRYRHAQDWASPASKKLAMLAL
jgi:hypothetical protein